MVTPAHSERQALNAANGAIVGTPQDPIILSPLGALKRGVEWLGQTNIWHSWAAGEAAHTGSRCHGSEYGWSWVGKVAMQDEHGRLWHHDFHAVIDDFGNLVEVQPC